MVSAGHTTVQRDVFAFRDRANDVGMDIGERRVEATEEWFEARGTHERLVVRRRQPMHLRIDCQ